MKAVPTIITPVEAEALLAKNLSNRKVSSAHVKALVNALKTGAWMTNGDAIRIDRNGTLLDGQHRLLACIEANTPIEVLLVTGLDPEVMSTIDCGRKRTVGDTLQIRGVPNANNIAATIRQLAILAYGDLGKICTTVETERLFALHNNVVESVRVVTHGRCHVPPSLLAAIHYVGTYVQNNRRDADAFVQVIHSGIPSYKGDPAHLWRERIIRTRGVHGTRMSTKTIMDGTLSAWDHFVHQRPLEKFAIREGIKLPGWNVDTLLRTKGVAA